MNICYRRLRPEREITMEIKDMRAFYAIVEEGNISHAAQRLDIAQPALSRQMKRLETSLGVQLFERGSRRIRLTDAGRVLYSRVEHILGMVDGTVREITEIGSGIAGSIQLGTITTSGALLLPELISEFHRRYPQVTYQIWEAEARASWSCSTTASSRSPSRARRWTPRSTSRSCCRMSRSSSS